MKRITLIISLVILLTKCEVSFSSDFTWETFYDPDSYFLTSEFAKIISAYHENEKKSAILKLKRALESSEVEIRRRAALILGELGDKSGVEVMIKDMEKVKDKRHRDNIIVALRILKDPRAIPILRKSLNDKSPYIRGIALCSLGEIKVAEAFEDIVVHLSDMESRNSGDMIMPPVALDAIYALGALGDRRAVPILIDLLDNPEYQDGLLKAELIHSLEKLTNITFGQETEKWKNWWQKRREK